MTLRRLGVLIRRGLLDLRRDRRTLVAIMLMPIIAAVFGYLARNEATATFDIEGTQVETLYVPQGLDPAFEAVLDEANIRAVEADDLRAVVRADRHHVALAVPTDLGTALEEGRPFEARFLIGGGNPTARLTQARVTAALERYRSTILGERLQALGLPRALAAPIDLRVEIASGPVDANALALGSLIPFLLAVQVLQLTTSVIADAIAGAKERRVLESLLASPATRAELLLGSGLVAVLVGAIAGMLTPIVGFISMDLTSDGASILTPALVGTFGVSALLIALAGAAAGMVAGALAKTTQQANLMLLPLIFGTIVPLSIFSAAGATPPVWTFALPGVGPGLLSAGALQSGLDPLAWPLAVLGTLAYTGLFLFVGARLFQGERVVTRG